jgi:hypothetical protein
MCTLYITNQAVVHIVSSLQAENLTKSSMLHVLYALSRLGVSHGDFYQHLLARAMQLFSSQKLSADELSYNMYAVCEIHKMMLNGLNRAASQGSGDEGTPAPSRRSLVGWPTGSSITCRCVDALLAQLPAVHNELYVENIAMIAQGRNKMNPREQTGARVFAKLSLAVEARVAANRRAFTALADASAAPVDLGSRSSPRHFMRAPCEDIIQSSELSSDVV